MSAVFPEAELSAVAVDAVDVAVEAGVDEFADAGGVTRKPVVEPTEALMILTVELSA